MNPLDLVTLTPLMARTTGHSEVLIALIDGPVALGNSRLFGNVSSLAGRSSSERIAASSACLHGTFVAGILSAKRGSGAPAICPDCTLLVYPIFPERMAASEIYPTATSSQLAKAIVDVVKAGARVLNMSIAFTNISVIREQQIEEALNYAASHGAITIAAAGNQGVFGSSAITRHPWVIPVTACDADGKPIPESNLGRCIGARGLAAPGRSITSIGNDGRLRTFDGTSAAVPFVSGTVALLWSEFRTASATEIRRALMLPAQRRRRTVVPPILDAWAAYQTLAVQYGGTYK